MSNRGTTFIYIEETLPYLILFYNGNDSGMTYACAKPPPLYPRYPKVQPSGSEATFRTSVLERLSA